MRSSDRRPNDLSTSQAQSMLLGSDPSASQPEHWRLQFPEIIGRCRAMGNALETVSKVAKAESSVLILGESGTGKELVAAAIHRLSPRSHKKFIALNCSAIPENLLESELFGHERGAFTGADKKRLGKFEVAEGGTIFLDEIGDMPMSLQAKLLRVLQERDFTPLGANETKKANVRIIAATNRHLEDDIQSGRFRKDLYFRLNVLPVNIPSLRERRDDIPALLDHFLESCNRLGHHGNASFLTDAAVEMLTSYSWPGNVRQLENLVERMVVMKGGGPIDTVDLPVDVQNDTAVAELSGNPSEFPLMDRVSGEGDFPARSNQRKLSEGRSVARFNGNSGIQPSNLNAEVSHGTGRYDDQGRYFGDNSSSNANSSGRQALGRNFAQIPGREAQVRYPSSFGELPHEGIDLTSYIETLENTLIRQALDRTGNNKNQAAKLLGLNRTTLVERIKKRKIGPLNNPSREL